MLIAIAKYRFSLQRGMERTYYDVGDEFRVKEIINNEVVTDQNQRLKIENVEIIERDVVELRYQLIYKGEVTHHLFSTFSLPDIRELGYDPNQPHEFKIISVIL